MAIMMIMVVEEEVGENVSSKNGVGGSEKTVVRNKMFLPLKRVFYSCVVLSQSNDRVFSS
jgi:hypothetical protein